MTVTGTCNTQSDNIVLTITPESTADAGQRQQQFVTMRAIRPQPPPAMAQFYGPAVGTEALPVRQ